MQKSSHRDFFRSCRVLGFLAWCCLGTTLDAGGFKDFKPPSPIPYYTPNPNSSSLFSDPYQCRVLDAETGWAPGTFNVVAQLKDGRTLSGSSQICRMGFGDAMRVTLNGETIFPNDTRLLQAEGMNGQPVDRGWIFPAAEGRITAYRLRPWAVNLPFDYLSKDGGGPQRYDDGVLRGMVWDHRRARGYMVRKAIGKGALWGSIIGAGALFFTAAVIPGVEYYDENGFNYRTDYRNKAVCVASGIGLLLTGVPIYLFTRKNQFEAVAAYNQTRQ